MDGAVRIKGNRIVAIGALKPTGSEQVIDLKGLALAPGFIDTHSHHDDGLQANKDALPVLSQGITTIVLGQDGQHEIPLAENLSTYEKYPVSVNVASYVGHNTIRQKVMGEDFKRHATKQELTRMRTILKEELAAGALASLRGWNMNPAFIQMLKRF